MTLGATIAGGSNQRRKQHPHFFRTCPPEFLILSLRVKRLGDMENAEIDPSLLEQFQAVTNADFAMAHFLLEASGGDFDLALNTFFGKTNCPSPLRDLTSDLTSPHCLHGSHSTPLIQNNNKWQPLAHLTKSHPLLLSATTTAATMRTDQPQSSEPCKELLFPPDPWLPFTLPLLAQPRPPLAQIPPPIMLLLICRLITTPQAYEEGEGGEEAEEED